MDPDHRVLRMGWQVGDDVRESAHVEWSAPPKCPSRRPPCAGSQPSFSPPRCHSHSARPWPRPIRCRPSSPRRRRSPRRRPTPTPDASPAPEPTPTADPSQPADPSAEPSPTTAPMTGPVATTPPAATDDAPVAVDAAGRPIATGRYIVVLADRADTNNVLDAPSPARGHQGGTRLPPRLPRLHGQARCRAADRADGRPERRSRSCPTRSIQLAAQTIADRRLARRRPRRARRRRSTASTSGSTPTSRSSTPASRSTPT